MIYPNEMQSSEAVAEHYNSLDDFYRKLWGNHVHHGYWITGRESVEKATEQLVDLVIEAGQIGENSKVFDVGCGYGETSRLLVNKCKANLTSLTISENQLKFAQSIGPQSSNPNYILMDFLQNDLPSNHFDTVFSIESSEHMPDKAKFFSEVVRILKPGGCFVTCAWLAKNDPSRFEVKHFLEPICREGRLPSMGSVDDYHQMMEDAGLSEINYRDLSKSVKKTWAICAGRTFKGFFGNPEIRRYILDSKSSDRVFAKTLFRIWGAYNTGSMRYGIFSAVKK